jgi:hypothetical protein
MVVSYIPPTTRYQSITSLAVYDRFDPLVIMKGRCVYLQVSRRPHIGSIGFRTKKISRFEYSNGLSSQGLLTNIKYIPTKGCKRHFSIRNAVESTDLSACALGCLCV